MYVNVERKIFGKKLGEMQSGELFIFLPSHEAKTGVYMKVYPSPYVSQISSSHVPVVKVFAENTVTKRSQSDCGSLEEYDEDMRVLPIIFDEELVCKIKE